MTRTSRRRRLVVIAMVLALTWCGVATGFATAQGRPISNEEYFGLILLPRDVDGVEVPIRNGDDTLGFAKACWKHNLCNLRAIALAVQGSGNKQPPEGSRVVYLAHVVGDGYDFRLRVVVDTAFRTRRGFTPDGKPVGVFTAYCEGMERCPDALNEA